MDLNTIKPSLGNLLIILLFAAGCINKTKVKDDTNKATKRITTDTCKLSFDKGYEIGSNISCRSCHAQGEQRNALNLPTMNELSGMDSLKLSGFLFTTKHKKNLDFFKDSPISMLRLKRIDSLSECDRKNLLHFIKEYSRPHKYILKTPNDTTIKK
jgi:hypothetical protein